MNWISYGGSRGSRIFKIQQEKRDKWFIYVSNGFLTPWDSFRLTCV
jgi:hypothetical protein